MWRRLELKTGFNLRTTQIFMNTNSIEKKNPIKTGSETKKKKNGFRERGKEEA
jgi:hypothetical protein